MARVALVALVTRAEVLVFPQQITMLLSVQEVFEKGLALIGLRNVRRTKKETLLVKFRKHYGSPPLVLANMWYDLTVTNIPLAALNDKEKSEKGFEHFMRAHYFLWTYPRNAEQFANMFGTNERNVQGKPLWNWISKIAALSQAKIKWPANHGSDPDLIYFSVDGTDCKVHEPHNIPDAPFDRDMKSEKFNKAGWKYLVALLVHQPQIVDIAGPFKATASELTIFRDNFKEQLRSIPGAVASADLGFRTSANDECYPTPMFAYPNSLDPRDVRLYKSRVRCRHESLFGRMKNFKILVDTFRYSKEKHKLAFTSVAVTMQYQMDNGSPLFAT